MSHLDPALAELANAYGIATEFWDWQGHHQPVGAETVAAVLAALGRGGIHSRPGPAGTDQPSAGQLAAAAAAVRGGATGRVPRTRRPRAARPSGGPVDRPRGRRRPARAAPAGELGRRPSDDRRPADRPGHLPAARRPAAGVPPLRARTDDSRGGDHAHRDAALGRLPGERWATGGAGGWRPSSTACARSSPGASAIWPIWPTSRCGPPPSTARDTCWSTRCTRPSRWRRWSPRRTCRPAGASPTRSTCGSSASPSTPRWTTRPAQPSGALRAAARRRSRRRRPDRPEHRPGRRSGRRCARSTRAPRTAGREHRLPRLPSAGRAQAWSHYATWCAPSPSCTVWTGTTGRPSSGTPTSPAVQTFRADARGRGGLPLLAAVGAGRAARDGPGRRPGQPGQSSASCTTWRSACTPAGADSWSLQDVFARGRHRRCTAGRVQPERPGLDAAAVAAGPAGRGWRTRRSAAWCRRCCGTPAGSASTTSSGCSGCGGYPTGRLPTAGTYVRYDHEALIGILALEAVPGAGPGGRARTSARSSRGSRTYLRERGILGTSILWFEFEHDARWRTAAAGVVARVLPGLGDHPRPAADRRATWPGDHVGSGTSSACSPGRSTRNSPPTAPNARPGWTICAPAARSADDADVEATVAALHRYLTWTPSRLLCVSLSDAVGDRRTQNQTGHDRRVPELAGPVDRRRTARRCRLEEVFTSERAAALAAVVRG